MMKPITDLILTINEPIAATAEQDRAKILAFGPPREVAKNADASPEIAVVDWSLLKLKAKQRWPKLMETELNDVDGDADKLIALLQLRYQFMAADAAGQVAAFFSPVAEVKRRDDFNGLWLQYIATAKTRWNKLNIKELEQCNGIKQSLVNLVSRRYKISPEDARRQVSQFILKCMYESSKAAD